MNEVITKKNNELNTVEKEALEMLNNPQLFVVKISELSEKLNNDKQRAEEIKNKGLIKRMFKSSIKLQAEANLRQNDIMNDFYQLLTAISYLSKGNSTLLVGLYNSLCKSEEANGNNMFYETAKASIQAAINSAENEEKREKALKKALVKANENESKINENETKIDSIKKDLLSRINDAVDLFKNHLNIRKKETEKDINSKIENTKLYIDEHLRMLNLRIEENNKSTISMINSVSKELSMWKIVAIISIVFNLLNLILIIIL
jgi:hypothetical protein